MEINFKGLRQSECSPAGWSIAQRGVLSCIARLLGPWRTASAPLVPRLPLRWHLAGHLDPFVQWCVKDTLEGHSNIFNYHGLCCTWTGRVAPALQLRDLNFEPALFTYLSSLCYLDKLNFSDCFCTAGMIAQSFLAGISAFKRLWYSRVVWR